MDKLTTVLFWDCNCERNYIHSRHMTVCDRCGTHRDSPDAPDSHIAEVAEAFGYDAEELAKLDKQYRDVFETREA